MLRFSSAGESHGRAIVAILEGVPAGVPIAAELVNRELARRQLGHGRGGRMQIERDAAQILAGVRFGESIGSPIALLVANKDWENWLDVMAVEPTAARPAPVTAPRPGHADLAGVWKMGRSDVRDVLERASARETVARVAAGAICKSLIDRVGMTVLSRVLSIGTISMDASFAGAPIDQAEIDASPVRCPDPAAAAKMVDAIDVARAEGQTLGGTFEVQVVGVVPGLGGYATATDRLDGRLAGALMSIPAVKGVEIGDGFALASRRGRDAHDEILRAPDGKIVRPTNRAGGLEGGTTNGQPVILRAAIKPIPTLGKPLASVDLRTGEAVEAAKERSDICVAPAAAVVAEAVVAVEMARALTEKFGADSLADIEQGVRCYRERIGQ